MGTILRTWSYQYQWLYDGISNVAAIAVGGASRFRRLALLGLSIDRHTKILDLCCGSGQVTGILLEYSDDVTGLDVSPLSLSRAQRNVPQAKYVEALAEEMPFGDAQFELVHTSAAMHEMTRSQLQQIFAQVYRVLKPGGIFTFVDFHRPTNPLFIPGLTIFFWLFETESAWQLIATDLVQMLQEAGFSIDTTPSLHAGGSLQVIQARKMD
jgi:demethylmenaquinone methyltransferase/2-methoxy-6-polyprenyl-1,4-benzoquinol methylase